MKNPKRYRQNDCNEFTSSSSDAQNDTQVPTSFIPEQLHLSDQGSQVTEWLQNDAQGEEEQRSECKPSLSFATLHSCYKSRLYLHNKKLVDEIES